MPTLYVLAGPNGAGKTTYYFSAKHEQSFISQIEFLNIDLIARNELGGYNETNFAKAETIYRERIKTLLDSKSDFLIESNLARSSDFDWITGMIKAGYNVVLFFLCTNDIDINMNRIKRRVKEGGHDVPPEIVIHRYKMVLTNLKGKLNLFNEVYLIENSSDTPVLIAQVINNTLTEYISPMPKWAEEVLFIAKRISKK